MDGTNHTTTCPFSVPEGRTKSHGVLLKSCTSEPCGPGGRGLNRVSWKGQCHRERFAFSVRYLSRGWVKRVPRGKASSKEWWGFPGPRVTSCYSYGYQLRGGCLFFVLFVLFHTAATGFDFSKKPRMISNFWSSRCHLPVLGVTEVSRSPWF